MVSLVLRKNEAFSYTGLEIERFFFFMASAILFFRPVQMSSQNQASLTLPFPGKDVQVLSVY